MTADSGSLAVLGAAPRFHAALHVGSPNKIDRARYFALLDGMLERNWLTNNGPLVCEFEQRVAALSRKNFCVATANGTSALELMLRASGVSGEVLVPAFTFVATAHALQWSGIRVVLCDVEPGSLTIDPRKIESRLNPKVTSAILAVNLWSRDCNHQELTSIAQQFDLKLLYDSAHAFGPGFHNMASFGLAHALSFHGTKFVSCGEGGAVVTDDEELAQSLRRLRNFGFTGLDQVDGPGINAKMPESAAAMGLCALDNMALYLATNRENLDAYQDGLRNIAGISLLCHAEHSNCHYVTISVNSSQFGLDRDQLMWALRAENILARRYFYPGLHKVYPYASSETEGKFPVAQEACENLLCLPTGDSMNATSIATVCEVITLCREYAANIRVVDGLQNFAITA